MRCFKTALLATAAFGCLTSAGLAADLAAAPLRGAIYDQPATPVFDGFYIGGHGGWGTADFKLSNSSKQDVQDILYGSSLYDQHPENVIKLPDRDGRSPVYGAFVGYNVSFDDVIVGVEGDYSRTDFNVNSTFSSLNYRLSSGQFNYNYRIDASSKAQVTDMGTFRVRAGYAMGSLMPYITFGAALGHGLYGTTTTYTQAVCDAAVTPNCNPSNYTPYTRGKTKTDAFYGGYSLGAGIEANLMANLFVRGEWQWVRFQTGGADATVNIARGGVGVRF